ncbi:MAG: FtsX-like permease family protein [Pseudomonadota bacterium]
MILRTLLLHYRRHPAQAFFFFAGIVIANVLLVGTQLINAQARASYERGTEVLGAGPVGEIVSTEVGGSINERLFIELRRQGFAQLAPVLRSFLRTEDGKSLEILGIDGLSMPATDGQNANAASNNPADTTALTGALGDFAFEPYVLLAGSARAKQLAVDSGTRIRLDNGRTLPPLRRVSGDELGHRLLLDLGALQELTDRRGKLSGILVFNDQEPRFQALLKKLPPDLEYVAQGSSPDPEQLTASLHLNLSAMGLLSCVVGLFLTYNAVAFSYTDRRELFRRLRLSGVAQWELARALLVELVLFIGLGIAAGAWLGSWLALRLLPGLGITLAQLYDVYISYPDSLAVSGARLPLLASAIAALLCASFPLRDAIRAPMLTRRASNWVVATSDIRDRALFLIALILFVLTLFLAKNAESVLLALLGMACLLLGSAFSIPVLIRTLIGVLSSRAPAQAAKANWLLADSRWLLGPSALALMAMALALVANGGLNTMIGSFRSATDHWLEERLAAQLFIRGDKIQELAQDKQLDRWLASFAKELTSTPRFRMSDTYQTPSGSFTEVEVVDLAPTPPYSTSVSLIRSTENAASEFFASNGVFISERAWRLETWDIGDRIELCPGEADVPIVGIYHDYGNPVAQWMVSQDLFKRCWPTRKPVGLGIHGPQELNWVAVQRDLAEHFSLKASMIVNQQDLRRIGLSVFDQTFAITESLNLLTLLVAGIGIFCSVAAIHHHRIPQQALLASFGLSRRERAMLLLGQWGALATICGVLVLPFSLALAWYLAAVVTPVAFGWSFPTLVDWAPYARLLGLALLSVLIAVALPCARLLRVSPATLLRERSI